MKVIDAIMKATCPNRNRGRAKVNRLGHHPIKDYVELLERVEDADDVVAQARPPQAAHYRPLETISERKGK